jgi:CHAT domain
VAQALMEKRLKPLMAQRQGAKAVMAGLWPVVDISTSLLMQNFYRLRLVKHHLSKVEALRRAQLSLLKNQQNLQSITGRNARARLGFRIEKDDQ